MLTNADLPEDVEEMSFWEVVGYTKEYRGEGESLRVAREYRRQISKIDRVFFLLSKYVNPTVGHIGAMYYTYTIGEKAISVGSVEQQFKNERAYDSIASYYLSQYDLRREDEKSVWYSYMRAGLTDGFPREFDSEPVVEVSEDDEAWSELQSMRVVDLKPASDDVSPFELVDDDETLSEWVTPDDVEFVEFDVAVVGGIGGDVVVCRKSGLVERLKRFVIVMPEVVEERLEFQKE